MYSCLVICLFYSLLHLSVGTHSSNDGKFPLHFAYITTKTGDFIASGGIPIVDLALKMINERDDILKNYTLNYTDVLDSGCSQTTSLDAFFELFQSNTTYVTLVGCGCSPATIPVAEISHYWNIPQIAFAAAAQVLNDRKRFRNFFRALPSFNFIPGSLVELMRKFEWRQMAIITQEESLFQGVTTALGKIFKSENWLLDSSVSFKTGVDPFPYDAVFGRMNAEKYRIIHINAYPEYAYHILCEAYYRNMYAPTYVWILPMWYNADWWDDVIPVNSSCTIDVRLAVLNGTIGTVPDGYFVMENRSRVSFSGLTPQQFLDNYTALLQEQRYQTLNLTELSVGAVTFDTVWSMAIGLDNAMKRIAVRNDSGCEGLPGELVPLEQFDYTNERVGCILRQGFAEVDFLGITGPVMFDGNGSRFDNVHLIKQYRISDNSNTSIFPETVAYITFGADETTFKFKHGESNGRIWKDGTPPYDGFPEETIHQNHLALIIIYDIAAFVGLIFVAVCLVFNIVFRNKKAVKLASPNLNYLIIVGATLMYICVYFYVHSSTEMDVQTAFCNIRFWLFSLGYTLCFAVILSKTWRVYYIFYNPTTQKKALKDWVLFVAVLVIVAIDLIIILVGSVIPQSRLIATETKDTQHPQTTTTDGIFVNNFIYVCTQSGSQIWLAISFSYKALLQLVAIFMAFHTRRIKVKALNDSKEIAVIIYINSIILTLLAVTQFALETYHDVYAAMFGLALLVDATLFLGLMYIPKMVSLYLDPNGENVFSHSLPTNHPTHNVPTTTNGHTNESAEEIITTLRARIKELESNKVTTQENKTEQGLEPTLKIGEKEM